MIEFYYLNIKILILFALSLCLTCKKKQQQKIAAFDVFININFNKFLYLIN